MGNAVGFHFSEDVAVDEVLFFSHGNGGRPRQPRGQPVGQLRRGVALGFVRGGMHPVGKKLDVLGEIGNLLGRIAPLLRLHQGFRDTLAYCSFNVR